MTCGDGPGESASDGDCKTRGPVRLVHPGARRSRATAWKDCNGEMYFYDRDGDGFGGTVVAGGGRMDCSLVEGMSARNDDCRDVDCRRAASTPAPSRSCRWHRPGLRCAGPRWGPRRDTFGGTVTIGGGDLDCTNDPREAAQPGDCDDTVSIVYPGAPEVIGDRIDQDCDGKDLCYTDADDDGFGTLPAVLPERAECFNSRWASEVNTDCDDGREDVYPGAPELASGVDQDAATIRSTSTMTGSCGLARVVETATTTTRGCTEERSSFPTGSMMTAMASWTTGPSAGTTTETDSAKPGATATTSGRMCIQERPRSVMGLTRTATRGLTTRRRATTMTETDTASSTATAATATTTCIRVVPRFLATVSTMTATAS